MKQQHINLLRTAANTLQSSMIQDENIVDLKKSIAKELAKKNAASIEKIEALNWMIEFARKRNKQYLQQYADIIQQLCEQPFTNLIDEIQESKELNPLFANILSNHFPSTTV